VRRSGALGWPSQRSEVTAGLVEIGLVVEAPALLPVGQLAERPLGLAMHQLYHNGGDPSRCARCLDDA
jgi:hypothetical protein